MLPGRIEIPTGDARLRAQKTAIDEHRSMLVELAAELEVDTLDWCRPQAVTDVAQLKRLAKRKAG